MFWSPESENLNLLITVFYYWNLIPFTYHPLILSLLINEARHKLSKSYHQPPLMIKHLRKTLYEEKKLFEELENQILEIKEKLNCKTRTVDVSSEDVHLAIPLYVLIMQLFALTRATVNIRFWRFIAHNERLGLNM